MVIHTQIAYDLDVEFVEAPGFTTLVTDYLDDDEFRGLQVFLAGKPDAMSCRGPVALGSYDGATHVVERASEVASG
jgi:hypothetical protein